MLNSSQIFSILSLQEKEINFDYKKINNDIVFVFDITHKKYTYCTSYCFCILSKYCKEKFFIVYPKDLFIIKLTNIESGQIYKIFINSNAETKLLQVPYGIYDISICKNDICLLKLQISPDAKSVVKISFDL